MFLVVAWSVFACAQDLSKTGVIKGRVVNAATKEPLVGVSVLLDGTSLGAATDANGDFVIRAVPIGDFSITASTVGYASQKKEVSIRKQNQIVLVEFKLEETPIRVGAVVVTATSTPHVYEEVPVRTEVISRIAIEKKNAINLADALSSQTGVRVEAECQNCNFTQVRLLGMHGRYSQILFDGYPVVSSLASVYGLEQIPEEMIQQIEIVMGGGSALYGPGAVAGVVNVITRLPFRDQAKIHYEGSWLGRTPDQEVGLTVQRVNDSGTTGAFIFASARNRAPYDRNGDGYSELVQLRNESLGATWFDRPFDGGELVAELHRIHEDRRGGNKIDLPPNLANIAEWLEHWRWGGSVRWNHKVSSNLNYSSYLSFGLTNRKSYFGGLKGNTYEDTLQALKFYGTTKDNMYSTGGQVSSLQGQHEITAGLQYTSEYLVDKATANPLYYIDQTYTDLGLFLQDYFSFDRAKMFCLVVGSRIDKHSEIHDWIVSPRVSALIKPTGSIALRLALSTGFMPPQIYNEDLHLCGVHGDQRVTRNSPGLKPERDLTANISIDYNGSVGSVPVFFSTTLFSTRLTDAFAEELVDKIGPIELWSRTNSSGAFVRGVELDASTRLFSFTTVHGGFTFQKSLYDQPLEDFGTNHFLKTPDYYGHFEFDMDPINDFRIHIGGIYTGQMYLGHEIVVDPALAPELKLQKVRDFLEIDVNVAYSFPVYDVKTTFVTGVKNVTDAFQTDLDSGINRDPGYFYGPGIPRTLFAKVELAF